MKSDQIFSHPLVVYKITSEKAFTYYIKILSYLSEQNFINQISIEDPNLLSFENFSKNTDSNSELKYNQLQNKIKKFELNKSNIDICIVIGGDGTTLWSCHLFENSVRPPFLNFNLGTLGYMAIYSCSLYIEVLDELFTIDKEMIYEKRSLLKYKIIHNKHEASLDLDCQKSSLKFNTNEQIVIKEGEALNDVVVEKCDGAHMAVLKLYFNNEALTVVKSDGLIVSTPTGSTAYNLSAGGSIIHHDVDSYILNAVCPHSLSFRAITFPRSIKLSIVPCASSFNKCAVTYDGMNQAVLKDNQYVEISLSDECVNFIVLTKFIKNTANLWKQKVVDQLGWNNAFKNID